MVASGLGRFHRTEITFRIVKSGDAALPQIFPSGEKSFRIAKKACQVVDFIGL
jgi:hypothetical protein